jgi:hypothetical protein
MKMMVAFLFYATTEIPAKNPERYIHRCLELGIRCSGKMLN